MSESTAGAAAAFCPLPASTPLDFNRITLRTHPHIHTRKVSSSVHTHLKHLEALKLRQQPYYSVMIARSQTTIIYVWKSYRDRMHICVCSFICATQMVKCFVDYGERTRSVIELGKQTLNKASVRCAYAYASVCTWICLYSYSYEYIYIYIQASQPGLRLRRDDRLKLNEISFRWSPAAANHLLVWMLDCWSATRWREGARYSQVLAQSLPPHPQPCSFHVLFT